MLGERLDGAVNGIHRALAELGHTAPPSAPAPGPAGITGAPAAWTALLERWYATSPLSPKTRGNARIVLAKTGRWLAAEHPEVTGPADWTRQTCASWVAAVDRMNVGDYVQCTAPGTAGHGGDPFKPKSKAGYLRMTRAFFRDCQEWEWIPRRFDPGTALATPRSIKALTGPDPRVSGSLRVRAGRSRGRRRGRADRSRSRTTWSPGCARRRRPGRRPATGR
jgi:hypothetical protein